MKLPRKKLILGLLILGGLFFFAVQTRKPVNASNWVPVRVEHQARLLNEVGTLEAKELSRIQAEIDGVITEIAEDGTFVKAGQLILKLDEEELQNQLEAEFEKLEQVQEDFQSQLAEYAVLTNSFQITTQLKKMERDHAALELEQGSVPLTEEDIRLHEIDIALAELDLQEDEARLARQEELVKQNFAPASSLERIRLETTASRTFLEEKKSQFELARQPVSQEERLSLEAALEKAEKDLKRNEERQALQLRTQEVELEGFRIDRRHKEEHIDRIKGNLEKVNTYAPQQGIIRLIRTYVWAARAWQPLSVGKEVRANDMMATIVDPNQLSIRLLLHESDYPDVKVGQQVRATLTAFPDEDVRGRIASITEVGQDRDELSPLYRQSPPVGQALFLARVELEKTNDQVLPGMTTHVEIEMAPPQKRILIPAAALRSEQAPYRVVRRRKQQTEEVTVEGEFNRMGRFEVTSGLIEGDEVYVEAGGES